MFETSRAMELHLRCHSDREKYYFVVANSHYRASQVMISLTSQSKLGYAKYRMRNEGRANRTVMSMYKAKMAALAGTAYKTIRINMRTSGNFAVK